jgi:hypothetical protein
LIWIDSPRFDLDPYPASLHVQKATLQYEELKSQQQWYEQESQLLMQYWSQGISIESHMRWQTGNLSNLEWMNANEVVIVGYLEGLLTASGHLSR